MNHNESLGDNRLNALVDVRYFTLDHRVILLYNKRRKFFTFASRISDRPLVNY